MMDKRKAQRKAEKRYVRKVIRRSVALLVLLAILGVGAYSLAPAFFTKRVEASIASGSYARALSALSWLRDGEAKEGYRRKCQYGLAEQSLAAGDFDAAKAKFIALGDYEDAAARATQCVYQKAASLYDAGQYEQAASLFFEAAGYADALDRRDQSVYALASELEQAGELGDAFTAFESLGTYGDANTRAESIAMTLTGASDAASAMAALTNLSEEEMAAQTELANARDSYSMGALAVGAGHTVGLKSDGTVVATGRSDYGQTNVGSWTNVAQVAAGADHTVALFQNGTVAAIGRGDEGQCDVYDWQNIVQVACGDYATFGLKNDGTVVACGYLSYALEGWRDVTKLSAGGYMAGAVYGTTGNAYATHASGQSEDFFGLTDVALTTGGAVGLKKDGTVTATFESMPDWSNVVTISAGSTCVLGIDLNGRVLAHYFRASDGTGITLIANAVAVAAGGGHSAVMDKDGRVYAFGDNTYGQCDTAGWSLR